MEIDILDLRRDAQHPGMHILATQKGASGNGTVRKADAISSSCTLDRLCKLGIERASSSVQTLKLRPPLMMEGSTLVTEKVKLRQAGLSSSMTLAWRPQGSLQRTTMTVSCRFSKHAAALR